MLQRVIISATMGAIFLILEFFFAFAISQCDKEEVFFKLFLIVASIICLFIGVCSVYGIMTC